MKDMTIKQKLIGMTIVITLMIAGLSLFMINRFSTMGETYQKIAGERVPQLQAATAMARFVVNYRLNINELNGVERNLENFNLFTQRANEKIQQIKFLEKAMIEGKSDLGQEIEGLKGVAVQPCRKGGNIEKLTQDVSALSSDYKELCDKIISKKKTALELVNVIGWYDSAENSAGVVKILVEKVRAMEELVVDQQTKLLMAEMRQQEKNILQRADERYITRLKDSYRSFDLMATGRINNLGREYFEAFETIFDKIILLQSLQDELKELTRTSLREKQKGLDEAVQALQDRAREQMQTYSEEAVAMENSARTLIMVIAVVVVILSLGFGWFVSNGINRVLTRIIENLSKGSDEVSSASGQVSAAGQSLAEGASEQAAAIEETSSSLEEMSSMTRQNAEHATQADTLMKEANKIVGQANHAMEDLTVSMGEISKASEETFKIIKTIDEIAFQTNLLALNAAVEAARAGEAGAGFAVVADEVRNLAMRAAEAAKNTSNLIEGTVKKIKDGSDLVTTTNDTVTEVAASASKVAHLVGEIASASTEQAQGIDQINKAVAEMDKVVQQNAANAEESASAAVEMNAQAEQMKSIVGDLAALVGGSRLNGGGANRQVSMQQAGRSPHPGTKNVATLTRGPANSRMAAPRGAALEPYQVIPMDDDEFTEF